ncbi:MFS transporter [Phragmitibacter flavus]|uniref:MFS transporter n=1 Tax=Phragmitibacter flavus TaxID=2576071 RepID=A0A5R8K9Y6_9BACT|nr:MFS transporter [Phragmitibacter flavus]TLD68339.1 MFS transporter [Phragmitibacter flavus]
MSVPPQRALGMTLLVAGTFFMQILDGTIIATALPLMAKSFGVEAVSMSIGMSVYMLTLAVFIPVSGWLSDRYGVRTIFCSAIAIFTLASMLCGLSESLAQFTGARILQGLGGAMMVPVGRLAVLRNTEKKDLVKVIALLTWPGLVAPILGPPLGGFIATTWSWHWIFLMNGPLGVLALGMSWWLLPREFERVEQRFDWWGFVWSALACGGLVMGIEMLSEGSDGRVLIAIWLVGMVAGVLAVRHARRTAEPLLDLWALRVKTFAISFWGGSLFRMAIGATPLLLPLMFQVGFGLDAFESGKLLLAVFVGNLAMKPATTWVLRRFGFRGAMVGNGILAAVSMVACGFLTPEMPRWGLLTVLFAGGLFRSMQFTSLNTLAFADVPKEKMSGANALYSTVLQLTFGMGVAMGSMWLRLGSWFYGEGSQAAVLGAFKLAFFGVGAVALLSALDCLRLARNAAAEVSGHVERMKDEG